MVDRSVWLSVRQFTWQTLTHWGLFVSGAVASVTGWILYALDVREVPSSVFFWIGGALLLAAMIRAFHDVRVDRDEGRHKRVTADERYQPRPKVVPYIDVALGSHFVPSNNYAVRFDNHGTEDAVNLRVAEIVLANINVRVRFPSDPRVIAPREHILIAPDVVMNDGAVSHDLGWAVRMDGAVPGGGYRPHELRVCYDDLHGRSFQTHGVFERNHTGEQVIYRFIESGLIRP